MRTFADFTQLQSDQHIRAAFVLDPGGVAARVLQLTDPKTSLPVFASLDEALTPNAVPAPDHSDVSRSAPPRSAGPTPATMTHAPDALAVHFEVLTRTLLTATTVGETLQQIAAAVVVLIPDALLVSLTLRRADGTFFTPVATDDIAVELDQVQYRTSQGPCLDAARPNGPAFAASDDLSNETRWPYFAAAATRHGLGAVLSTELPAAAGPDALSGALNIYFHPHGLNAQDKHRALLLATHAALALAHTHATEIADLRHTQLRKAIDSRDVIGQAKGILMARRGLTAEQAFDLLRRTSQDLNIKLSDLAATLVNHPTELG
ncbi:ANTAR domain-containing protein [Nocardia brasiliensis]|uniref:ANTAR domain-containing protein n=1 Tax=Nocardia brasiliensis TaxID=37326 RepID=UPI00366BC8B4